MFLIYDREDNAPVIEPNLQKVADFLGLTLASLRSYISKKHPIKNGYKLYEIEEITSKSHIADECIRRVL
jgi:predicted transcriptional regulator